MRLHAFAILTLLLPVALSCSSARRGKNSLLASDTTAAAGDAATDPGDVGASDGVDSSDGPPDAGGDGQPDVVTELPDAESPAPDTGPPLPDVQAEKPVFGGILVVQVESSAVQTASVSAAFSSTPAPSQPPLAEVGSCRAYASGQPTSAPSSLDAGAISLTGLAQPVTLTPAPAEGGLVKYTSGLPSDLATILGNGASITATTTGGADLPAFTLTAPNPKPVAITTPTDTVGADGDLTIAWVKGEASLMRVDVFVLDVDTRAPAPGAVLACEVPGDPGQLVVSSTLLKKLPDLGSGPFGPAGYLAVAVSRVHVGEVAVEAGTASLGVTRTSAVGVPFEP